MAPIDRPAPIVLDCDPGHDDAMAILLAAADPRIELRAITTVAGNQTLDKTTLNARRVCTVAGIGDVPIAAGCDRPLVRELYTAADIHGESGLDGPHFGEPGVGLDERHAVELLHEMVQAEPARSGGRLTLAGVGPLTNLATLLQRYPEDRELIERIVIMGGSTERGNTTPYAEFNIYVDPEAAAAVLASGVPTLWHGLNVTHQAGATDEVLARIGALGTTLGEVCVDLLTFFRDTYRDTFGFGDPPVHDPVAVASIIDPAVVETRTTAMRVEVDSELTRGATVVDLVGRMGWEPNAEVGMVLDHGRFWTLLIDAIEVLGTRGPLGADT